MFFGFARHYGMCCLGIFLSGWAEVKAQATDTLLLHEKTVQVDQDAVRLAANQSEIVLQRRDWQGRQLSLADILAEQAGIETRRYGGLGSFQSISMRGSTGTQVDVYLDDVPLNSAAGGPVDLGKMDLNLIDRIEIRKGFATAADGGHAMGGVIRLYSRQFIGSYGRTQVTGSRGSHCTEKEALSWASSEPKNSNPIKVFASISRQGSQNDFAYLNRNQTPYNQSDDSWTRRKNSAFASLQALVQAQWLAHQGSYRIQMNHQRYSGGIPGREGEETVSSGFSNQSTQYQLQYEGEESEKSWVFGWQLVANETNPEVHWTRADGIGWNIGGDSVQMLSHSRKSLGQAHFQPPLVSWLRAQWKSQTYATASQEQQSPSYPKSTNSISEWENQRLAVHLAHDEIAEWKLGHQSLLVWNLGLQSEGWLDQVRGALTPYGENIQEQKRYHQESAWRVGSRWQWKDATAFYANTGRYYHAPSLTDRFGTHFGVLANPDLKPERGWNVEVGWRQKWKSGFFETTLFRNETEDAIVYQQSLNLIKPFNMDRILAQGLEGMANWKGPFLTDFSVNGVLQKSRNLSNTYRFGNEIPNQPKVSVHTHESFPIIENNLWGIRLEHRWDWRSEIYRDPANVQRLPALSLHQAMISTHWKKDLTMQVGCQNIANVFYEDVYSSYPYPGRVWQTTLSFAF